MNPPATREQLEKLAALYGLKLVLSVSDEDWIMWESSHVQGITFSIYTPIEAWIARLVRWRRERL